MSEPRFTDLGPDARAAALLDADTPSLLRHEGAALFASGLLDGRPVLVAATDPRQAGGSLGVAECAVLADAFRQATGERRPLLLLLDSAGARMPDGVAVVGAFRALFREAMDAVLAGVPVLALVGGACFGGASILACFASRRLYAPRSLLGASGPKVVQALGGADGLDAGDRDAVRALFGAAARVRTDSAGVLVEDAPAAWRAAAIEWLDEAPSAAPDIARTHRRLGQRLDAAGIASPAACPPSPALAARLDTWFPDGWKAEVRGNVLIGSAAVPPFDDGGQHPITLLGLVDARPSGATDCWRLADALLASPPDRPAIVLMDCPGQAPTRTDESLLISEYLTHAGLALTARRAAGQRIELWLIGEASGATCAVPAAGAGRVLAWPEAVVRVLPAAAVASIVGPEGAEAVTGDAIVRAGVADAAAP